MPEFTERQNEFFRREGYLMVPDVFAPADLEPLRDEFTEVIHQTAVELQAAGKLSRLYEEEPFERRLSRIYAETDEILGPIVGRGGGGYSGPALFAVITHPRLLAVVESLIGPEIVASSVYRVRPKIPGMAHGVVPWHQDSGYFNPHCDRDLILTCWIPLVDATVENGCLEVLPRAHRQGVVRHYTEGPNGYLAIDDGDLPHSRPAGRGAGTDGRCPAADQRHPALLDAQPHRRGALEPGPALPTRRRAQQRRRGAAGLHLGPPGRRDRLLPAGGGLRGAERPRARVGRALRGRVQPHPPALRAIAPARPGAGLDPV